MECLENFQGILFDYKINVFPDHTNLVYAETQSKYKRVMCWRLILEGFGPNTQNIARVDNIVANTLSRTPYTKFNQDGHITSKTVSQVNKLFATRSEQNPDDVSPVYLIIVQRKHKKNNK